MSDILVSQFRSWASGIRSEIEFWDGWMNSKGGEWKDDFNRRLEGKTEISQDFLFGLDDPLQSSFLDVGSGPISAHGTHHHGVKLNFTLVDPLAPFYLELGIRHGVPISVQQGFAEDLTAIFSENSFDRVLCQNALDHSFDPLRGIEEMIRVTKVGGKIFLIHYINEAEFEGYAGFHQWNFDESEGNFLIWNKHEDGINVSKFFERVAIIKTYTDRKNRSIVVHIDKIDDFHDDLLERMKDRNQNILKSIMNLMYDQHEKY